MKCLQKLIALLYFLPILFFLAYYGYCVILPANTTLSAAQPPAAAPQPNPGQPKGHPTPKKPPSFSPYTQERAELVNSDSAVALQNLENRIQNLKLRESRELLLDFLRNTPSSPVQGRAMDLLGEIQADLFLSTHPMPGKIGYLVEPGDSLLRIANKTSSTPECIMRVNNLLSTVIHPGQRLIVIPVNFIVTLDVASKTLLLYREGSFFKRYLVQKAHDLPSLETMPPQTGIASKVSWYDGRQVLFGDPNYYRSVHRLSMQWGGVEFYSLPAEGSATGKSEPSATPSKVPAPATPANAAHQETATSLKEALEPRAGFIFSQADIEEIFALINHNTIINLTR